MEQFLKVKWVKQNIVQYMKLTKHTDDNINELNSNDILMSVSPPSEEYIFYAIKDQNGVNIPIENLAHIVHQYIGCACFCIEIHDLEEDAIKEINVTESDSDENSDELAQNILSGQALKRYIRRSQQAHILYEYDVTGTLIDSSRNDLVLAAKNFLRAMHGDYPSKEAKIACAKGVIDLFPIYITPNSKFNGIDLFYNPEKNSGYLMNTICNGCTSTTKLYETFTDSDTDNEMLFDLDATDKYFFQNCLPYEHEDQIKDRLAKTSKLRQKLFMKDIDIYASFPFFFFNPGLILYDFELRYPKFHNNLINEWGQYSKYMKSVYSEITGKTKIEFREWSAEINTFLILLKLLPIASKGQKSKGRKRFNFDTAISRLIIFQDLNKPTYTYDIFDKQPHIIAVGANRRVITQYYIVLDGSLLCVPKEFTFVETFDLIFKVFYVFNVDFDNYLQIFYNYFATYIYKIGKIKTSRMIEVNSKFENKFKIDD